MSAEFIGFPGNCNGSPSGKIEKNHPQHFDEFCAIFVCCKILAKRDSERI